MLLLHRAESLHVRRRHHAQEKTRNEEQSADGHSAAQLAGTQPSGNIYRAANFIRRHHGRQLDFLGRRPDSLHCSIRRRLFVDGSLHWHFSILCLLRGCPGAGRRFALPLQDIYQAVIVLSIGFVLI